MGALGILVHYDGTSWSLSPESGMDTNVTMRAVWASVGSDVWNVGTSGTDLHYDGSTWTPVSSGVSVTL